MTLWEQDSFISAKTLAIAFAVLTAMPHIVMFTLMVYYISNHVRSKCHCDTKRKALKTLAVTICKKHDYEENEFHSLAEEEANS